VVKREVKSSKGRNIKEGSSIRTERSGRKSWFVFREAAGGQNERREYSGWGRCDIKNAVRLDEKIEGVGTTELGSRERSQA